MTEEEWKWALEPMRRQMMREATQEEREGIEQYIDSIAEPCGDCISRQAVDDAIYDYSRSCDVNYAQIMDYIDKLPSVNPQEPKTWHWIPVTERLPDIHNYCVKYLVTDCNGNIYTSLFTESGGKSWWSHEDIIAWMPLPEPYKTESEDGE